MDRFRDIRKDLAERIEAARARKEKALADAEAAAAEEEHAKALFALENRRIHGSAPRIRLRRPSKKPGSPVAEFLEQALSNGHPRSLDELNTMAWNWGVEIEDGKSLKRSLNAALLGWKRYGRAEKDEDGKWRILKQDAPPAATDEASDE